jgi:uncharacterized protein Usg
MHIELIRRDTYLTSISTNSHLGFRCLRLYQLHQLFQYNFYGLKPTKFSIFIPCLQTFLNFYVKELHQPLICEEIKIHIRQILIDVTS